MHKINLAKLTEDHVLDAVQFFSEVTFPFLNRRKAGDRSQPTYHTCPTIRPQRHRTKQLHCQQTQTRLIKIKWHLHLKMHPNCRRNNNLNFTVKETKGPDRNLHIWVRISVYGTLEPLFFQSNTVILYPIRFSEPHFYFP